jgi:hypothetical protein
MPPRTAAARHRHAARPRPAAPSRHTRRVSGPLRPAPAGAAVPARRGTTGVFERLRALPEHRMVDRLLRGRVWIALIGIMLGGIVAMQVSLLKLNAGISRAVEATSTLERQNSQLEARIGRLSTGEKVRSAATATGMVAPPAGDVEFLSVGERDARRAVNRMQPPSDEAIAIMRNGGFEPGVLAAAEAAAGVPAVTAPTDTAATAPVDPAATAPAEEAATAPVSEPTPVPPATGAATAPEASPETGAAVAP